MTRLFCEFRIFSKKSRRAGPVNLAGGGGIDQPGGWLGCLRGNGGPAQGCKLRLVTQRSQGLVRGEAAGVVGRAEWLRQVGQGRAIPAPVVPRRGCAQTGKPGSTDRP